MPGPEVIHVIVASSSAPQTKAAVPVGQQSPAVVAEDNDLTLTGQRRDRQNRVKRS